MSRLVIYYSSSEDQQGNAVPLGNASNLPYTDVILGFLIPDPNDTTKLALDGGASDPDGNLKTDIGTLHTAGKNVLISVGGEIFPANATKGWRSLDWRNFAGDPGGLVGLIVSFVQEYDFDGVDIDYEDDAGFIGKYDGIGFLSALTSGLSQALPQGQNIITHAPQTPYWDPGYYEAPYAQIWNRVGQQIAWINNQFYNNTDYDKDAATKVSWYQKAASIVGAEKLLAGVPLTASDAGEGYIAPGDMVQNVIEPLQAIFGSQFGGVMGWEFSSDQGGAWANLIGQALGQQASSCLGESYIVVAEDTLSLIAQRFLGSGDLWVDLRKPDGTPFTPEEAQDLQVGQLVYIPPQSIGSSPLAFLEKISGTRTVAGQHNREPNSSPAQWTNKIYDTTGRFPGLWSGDFLYEQDNIDNRSTMIAQAIDQWNQGALVHLMYHAAPPDLGEPCGWDPGVVNHPLSDDQWNGLITDGSDLNNAWKARLDTISVFFQELKDQGVQVLWRPFHEMNKPMDPSVNPFWWCGRPGPNGSARLYQITHDYMVGTKGLTNLIWVWDVQDLNFDWASYNPGDGYWDVFAMDMYGDGYTSQKYETALQVAGTKPMAIGECEILPTADELAAQPRWTFFMAWAELVFADDNGNVTNTVQQITDLYNATNVVTRDQMPGWG